MPVYIFRAGVPIAKRLFDLVLTTLGLIVISPILIAISLAIWISLGLPILFRQQRPGFKGESFTVYKYRSMTDARDQQGSFLSDKERITKLGRFLRSASLDELPELINVMKGEMSLVGPRPLLMQYLPRYSPEQARRHDVISGMTGWAQIHGRNILSWEDKFKHDVWYVDNWSFWLDIKILVITLWKVIRREGISQPGYISAEEFMGSQSFQEGGDPEDDRGE